MNAGEAKLQFSILWAVCAGKKIRLKSGSVHLSFHELSRELSKLFNEWYGTNFTIDAFYKAYPHKRMRGEDENYDRTLMRIHEHDDCLGLYTIHNPCFIPSANKKLPFCETNVVTGEQKFYVQNFENGKPVDEAVEIDGEEYDKMCYSMRE